MHLVLIDLIPALLSWEGRDRSDPPGVPEGAEHALGHLYDRFQVIGVADSGIPAAVLRRHIVEAELAIFFDRVLTSAPYGPRVNARVVRRMIGRIAPRERAILVTARRGLGRLGTTGTPVVMTTHDDFEAVYEAVYAVADGRISL